jgi:23S rRNA-/tRNA-specific pseudouridylate synthase
MIKKYEVEKDFHNTRFDRWFKNKVLDIPQGLIEKIIRKNQAKVYGKKMNVHYQPMIKVCSTIS